MTIPSLPAEYTAASVLRKGARREEASIPGPIFFLHAPKPKCDVSSISYVWK